MKVQVVQLDPHDDQVSARDKLAWVKAPRVLLVWPDRGGILNRQLDLVLLQRQAQRQRSQLALVAQDPLVRDHAEVLGIPVFESVDRISEGGWRRGRRRSRAPLRVREPMPPAEARVLPAPHPPRTPSRIQPIMGAAALFSLAAAAAAVLPSARIVLTPETAPQQATLAYTLVAGSEGPADAGSLAAQRLTGRFSDELRLPTTGEVSVPATFAEGEVVFVNLTSQSQTVPARQSIRPAGQQELFFLTQETIHLEAARGARATAAIRAAVPGEAGNLAARQITAVDGPVGLVVSVTNPSATTGGTSQVRAAATDEDRADLYERLEAELTAQAEAQWQDSVPADSRLAPGSVAVARVLREQYSSGVGEPADSHALFLEVEIAGLAYRRADLESAVATALDASLDEGEQAEPRSLQLEILAAGSADRLRVRAVRRIFHTVDRTALARSLVGKRVGEAERILLASGLAAPPAITLYPGWFPTLPWSAIRIEILWGWEAE